MRWHVPLLRWTTTERTVQTGRRCQPASSEAAAFVNPSRSDLSERSLRNDVSPSPSHPAAFGRWGVTWSDAPTAAISRIDQPLAAATRSVEMTSRWRRAYGCPWRKGRRQRRIAPWVTP